MKKLLAILFTFFYLASSAGVTLNLHYCGGKIRAISFHHTDEQDCCKGKMKKNCCKETSASMKIEDNQASSSSLQVPDTKSVELFILSPLQNLSGAPVSLQHFSPFDPAPPDLYQAPPYLRNRVLLI